MKFSDNIYIVLKIHYHVFLGLQSTIFCIRIDDVPKRRIEENGRMKIIKRNGSEEGFDIRKIVRAVTKADTSTEARSLTDSQI